MFKNRVLPLVDWFVPPYLRSDIATLWRARIFTISHMFGPCLGASIIVFLYKLDPHPDIHAWTIAGCDFSFALLPFGLRLTGRLPLLATISVATLTFVSFYGSYFYGGVSSPFLPWVLTALLLGFFYLREKPLILLSVFSINLAGFYLAYLINGSSFPERIPQAGLSSIGILSVFCATIYTSMMAIYYANVVTSQSQLEQEVQRHLAMAVELRRAKDHAENANRAKSVFLAKMSHQLRTPLNAVIGYSEILLEDDQIGSDVDKHTDLKRINNAGKHLLSLVTDVLDLSKIDNQDLDLAIQPFDLKTFIDDVADTCRSLIINNGNEFRVQCDDSVGTIVSDPTRLRQAILNLLSNAGKFTKRGTVVLSVQREPRDGVDWIVIAVRDTGIGIKPENLERLFTDFSQAEASTSRRFGGTGLGLALSQSLCHAMNGEIRVESEFGRGSCFTIEIPAHLIKEAEKAGRDAGAPGTVSASLAA